MQPGLSFPPVRATWLPAPEIPADLPLRWRAAVDSDLAFFRHLYGLLRADELAAVPWPEAARTAFLDSQFALQHHHYTTHFADADFLVIECGDEPVGRLYVSRRPEEVHIIDIALVPSARGRGWGGALLRHVLATAANEGVGCVRLHVEQRNLAARRLYERLGFTVDGPSGHHWRMSWSAPEAAPVS